MCVTVPRLRQITHFLDCVEERNSCHSVPLYPRGCVVFRRVRKIGKRIVSFVVPVRPSAWNGSAPTGRSFMEFDIWGLFENMLRTIKFYDNLTSKTGTLREDLCMFIIISR